MSEEFRIMTQIHFQVNSLYSQGENESERKIYDSTIKRSEWVRWKVCECEKDSGDSELTGEVQSWAAAI